MRGLRLLLSPGFNGSWLPLCALAAVMKVLAGSWLASAISITDGRTQLAERMAKAKEGGSDSGGDGKLMADKQQGDDLKQPEDGSSQEEDGHAQQLFEKKPETAEGDGAGAAPAIAPAETPFKGLSGPQFASPAPSEVPAEVHTPPAVAGLQPPLSPVPLPRVGDVGLVWSAIEGHELPGVHAVDITRSSVALRCAMSSVALLCGRKLR